jgi:ribosomal protein S18 acetylase RimI-like enzyme
MKSREIASAMASLGADSLAAHMLADPVLIKRYGFAVVRRRGMRCYSSTRLEAGVFNHVSGYGTFAAASQRAIDTVLRYYESLGGQASFEVMLPAVSRADRALLERNGFRDKSVLFQCHVRTSTQPPRAPRVAGLEIARVRRAEAERYGKLASRGFGDTGTAKVVFETGWARQIRRDARVAAFIGSVDGKPASTGVTIVRPNIAALYSGSVLPAFRGRGIQNAMIARRVAHGWARGVRTFYSWSDPDNASARNLRDEGFRTRFEVHWYGRKG